MDSNMLKIRQKLDSIITFLGPLLPLANCHMVEFITERHWERLVPAGLRRELESCPLNEALDNFWDVFQNGVQTDHFNDTSESELTKFVSAARRQYLAVDNAVCLDVEQFTSRIKNMGCDIERPIHIKEFMSTKKSYEVETMSPLVASLFNACGGTQCVDVGGGRGYLPLVLDLGYRVPSLAVDCDLVALGGGRRRDRLIKKQWPSIAKGQTTNVDSSGNLHHFVHAFVTKDSDLCGLVREHFPEHLSDNIRLILTGLHTCGNLGPDSLRIFTCNPSTVAVLNVPCCYHLLTEALGGDTMWAALEGELSGDSDTRSGFPMSQCLTGYQLGRNARMLAAQSIDRVVSMKQLPSKSLHYRAVLQAIIKKHLPNSTIPEGKLKRMTSKVENFADYFKKADAILKLGLHDSLSVSYLTDVYTDCDSHWDKLIMFYLLRLCLAQVVETIILLDRLLFLYENGYSNAFLVKLFDATLSPRCHAIFAMR